MRGSFRRDLELAPGEEFRLRRKPGPRLLSALLALAGLLATAVDLLAGRLWLAAAQLALSVAFVALLVQAELDTWRFEGAEAVRRTFVLRQLRFRVMRVGATQIRTVSVGHDGTRTRAWIETRDGDAYALVEGDKADVARIVVRLTAGVEELFRWGRDEPRGWRCSSIACGSRCTRGTRCPLTGRGCEHPASLHMH